ncbi:Pyruvate:ferredoxin oxidoreductase or related 2-oxoacid:ferredoxin oxidoreductase, beta subunit [Halanaeroarchaeum sp. HSR-CO]|uniref:thiamine pyrophosphate-dependent enzyme n=1 Tax=Halanaeroarchaeum sp. HSR-CO TaxID=2866382 RepID=UPI00217F01FD|nr:thiamine pyrophosphate-dependent enzyme [Halanaeroarchaeum sp. HSR-CO]UWG46736.1 Pyruvate:ferredoxin oxidoreductase or related 2-oxoacid:ferredoxin oxidoreductase, beta subunit [Halanaeroarchaeum sp. HSR-CO]
MSTYDLLEYLREDQLPHTMCPGCGGGTVLNTFAATIDRMGIDRDDLLLVSGIGCSAWIPSPNFEADTLHTTHGRAIAFATGAKVGNPALETVVISGDGDLAGIGGNHLLHAARRNVDITVILVNNFTYGMTGGQVAPTTPHESMTTTSPYGNPEDAIDIAAVADSAGASFVARQVTSRPQQLIGTLTRAIENDGFSLVEVISQCPTVYGRRNEMASAPEMLDWMEAQVQAGDLEVGPIAQRDRSEFVAASEAVEQRAIREHVTEDRAAPTKTGDDLLLRIAGEGGQGTVVAGTIIGEAAAINGRNVFKTEEYGSRARGGVASSDLIISDTRIHEAKVPEGAADVLVALTDASLADHRSVLREGGRLIVDADRVTEPPAAAERVPFTGIATDVATERSTNMAVLGYLNAALDIADDSVVEESIESNLDASIEDNLAVYRRATDEPTDADS